MSAVTEDVVRRAPKVLLHDHLDGGLRAATLVDLAESTGYQGLPTTDVPDLARWFAESAYSGSLERYLDTFPFQYYLIVHNLEDLPGALAGLLRTWFAEVNQ